MLYRSRVQRLVNAGLTENKTMFGDTQHLFQLDCRSRFSKHYTKLLIWERKHGGGAQRNITIDTYLISRIRCAALLQITFTLLIFKKTVQIITLYLDWSSIKIIIIIINTSRLRTMNLVQEFRYTTCDHLFQDLNQEVKFACQFFCSKIQNTSGKLASKYSHL